MHAVTLAATVIKQHDTVEYVVVVASEESFAKVSPIFSTIFVNFSLAGLAFASLRKFRSVSRASEYNQRISAHRSRINETEETRPPTFRYNIKSF